MSNSQDRSGAAEDSGANASTESTPTRRPRNIVTPSGRGVRGYFPSRKAPKPLKFESLVEQDVLRVLEISTLPKVLATQPCVLRLRADGVACRYTPDAQVTTSEGAFLLEAKDDSALGRQDSLERLRRVISGIRGSEHHFVLILRSDVRRLGIQQELEILLRERPAPGRYIQNVDTSLWDPHGKVEPSDEMAARWAEAKRICDELLRRVMGRDPDELITNLV